MEHFVREKCLKKFKIYYGVDFGTFKIETVFLSEIFSCTVTPRLTKINRSGITFVSRNVISRRFL